MGAGQVKHGEHAIVLGGSISGMASAAAVSPHFTKVTIVERDELPEGPENRRGVPQGTHTHALMTGGRDAFEALMPGFSDRMVAAGAPIFDQPRDIAFLTGQGWLKRAETGVETFFARRPVLEAVVRDLIGDFPNIELLRATATGVLATDGGDRVTGVTLECDGEQRELTGDLVIDATGRASRATKWLEALGYDVPDEVEVQPHLGYASRLVKVPDEVWPEGVTGVIALPYPGETRGGSLLLQDNGYTIMTTCGSAGDFPPGDEAGFEEFLQTAMTPILWDIYQQSEPLTEITTTRTSLNRMRQYHKMERRPAGFVCIGDSMQCMNPGYGQGMTNCSRQALEFARQLGEPGASLDAVVDGFPARVIEINAFAWGVAVGGDMRLPTTEAIGLEPPTAEDLAGAEFFTALERAATADGWLVGLLQGAINQMDPTPLFAPEVQERVAEWAQKVIPAEVTDLTRVPAL